MDPPPDNGLRTLQHSPEQLATDFLSQPSKFLSLLHTNYACHFQDIDNVLLAADLMSRSDIYTNEWRVSITTSRCFLQEFKIKKKRKS